jgi:hypothetical protein
MVESWTVSFVEDNGRITRCSLPEKGLDESGELSLSEGDHLVLPGVFVKLVMPNKRKNDK